jgi:predicted PurR-regulated permease PerM
MERRYIEPLFFLALFVGTAIIVFLLFRPFLYILAMAGVLAYLTNDIYNKLLKKLRSPSATALAMTVFVFALLLVPLTLIGLRLTYEASGVYTHISQQATQESIVASMENIQRIIDRVLPGVTLDSARITERLGSVFGWLVSNLGSLLGSFASLVVNFLLLLMFYYYLVRDGYAIKEKLKDISPMTSDKEDQIVGRIGRAITSTVRGSLVMALLQGLVSGIGFVLFGVPNPALWGSIVVLAAFIPTVGTALIQIPVILFLTITGHPAQAVGAAIWASLAVGMLDNVLGPKLMARGMHMHPLVTLLAILGGISFYGPVGLLLGPITLALLYALIDIYIAIIQKPASSRS